MTPLIPPTTNPANRKVEIAQADDADFPFVEYLRKMHSNAVGYIPAAALRELLERRTVLIGLQNSTEAGAILYRPYLSSAPHICPIVAAAVDFEAQRRTIGLSLVAELADKATANGSHILQAWCRADLDANKFWRTAGFLPTAIKHGQNVDGQPLILWRKMLRDIPHHILFRIPPRSGWKARRTTNARRLTANEAADLATAIETTANLSDLSRDLR